MPLISLITAVDEKWGIGRGQQLLCHLPADMVFFKQQTLGKPIIMGRKTHQSIGRSLPGRLNIVVSRQSVTFSGVTVVPSIEAAIQIVSNEPEAMIIGGAQVYRDTLIMADQIYLTRIHHQFEADVFFPALDPTQWTIEKLGDHSKDEKNPYDMSFYLYQRNFKKSVDNGIGISRIRITPNDGRVD